MADGRYEDAIPIYRRLVKAVPGNAGLILNLGLAEEFAGHPEQAVTQFESVLKTQPANVPALTSLAMARLQLKQPGLATAPLRKLVGLEPGDRNARGMLASALLATDHAAEAAAQYRTLGESDVSDAKAWYGLGSAYEAEANQAFGRLMQVATESAYSAALLAEVAFSAASIAAPSSFIGRLKRRCQSCAAYMRVWRRCMRRRTMRIGRS